MSDRGWREVHSSMGRYTPESNDNDDGVDDQPMVELDFCSIIRETEMAWLLEIDGEGNVWVPKSLVPGGELIIHSRSLIGITGIVTVPEWWAIKEGLV